MGLKHSGKSSLGKLLAKTLTLAFFDLDDLTLEMAKTGKEATLFSEPLSALTCRDLYRQSPELFRAMELQGAKKAADALRQRPLILALGGGTMENTPAMETLAPLGYFIYINTPRELLYKRILAGGVPPFLDARDPQGSFAELYRRRDSLCRDWADHILNMEDRNLEEGLGALETLISEKRKNVWQ